MSEDELQTLKKLVEEIYIGAKIADILARPAARDFDTLLHHNTNRPRSITCYTHVLIALIVITVVYVSYTPFHSRVIESRKARRDSSNPELSAPETANLPQAAPRSELSVMQDGSTEQIQYARYTVPIV
jgi:hypothetical protein